MRAIFGSRLEKLCSEFLASGVKSNTIVCRHGINVCVFALVRQGSWKSDSKHQTGKQPPARTDRRMFVCVSPVTVFVCVHLCIHLCHCMCVKYIYYLSPLKLALKHCLFLASLLKNSMHTTPSVSSVSVFRRNPQLQYWFLGFEMVSNGFSVP